VTDPGRLTRAGFVSDYSRLQKTDWGDDMEMQFVDAATGSVLGECRDTEIGRKYAADTNAGVTGAVTTWASGYANSFQAWSYAKNAFDKWAQLTAQRFAELRGTKLAK